MNNFTFAYHSFVNWVFGLGGLGALVAILAWAAWIATPAFLLPLKSLILQIAVGATVFTFAWSYATTTAYKAGYSAAITAIEKHSAKLGHVGSGAWKDVKTCFENGGEWNTERGTCDTN